MGLIAAERYAEMRARERAGERGVFFPEDASTRGVPRPEKGSRRDPLEALEATSVLTPRVRRRTTRP